MILICTCFNQSFAGIINVKKLGAKGDGKTDDTKAIQAAINAAPENTVNTIYFPKGIYIIRSYTITKNYLENYFLLLHSNLTFKGEGKASTIRLGNHLFDKKDTSATAQIFFGSNISTVTFSNLQIDMNGGKNLCPPAYIKNQRAIFINHGSDVTIEKMTIKNNAGRNMVMLAGTGQRLLIKNNNFLNGGHYVGITKENENQLDFSFVYCEWDSTTVINNRIEQQNINIALNGISGGIEIHGTASYAATNKIIGCSPAIYISSSWHVLKNVLVEKNNFFKCAKGVSFWLNYSMDSISIKDNQVQLTNYRRWKGYTSNGIEMPNGNTTEYDNQHANGNWIDHLNISGNIINAPVMATNTDRTAGMVLHSLRNCIITNNSITGMNFGGIIIQGSKWGSSNVSINNNNFFDFTDNNDLVSPAAYIVIFDSYVMQQKDAAGLKNILVASNLFNRKASTSPTKKDGMKKSGQFFGAFIALPEGLQKEVHFENNNFTNNSEKVNLKITQSKN